MLLKDIDYTDAVARSLPQGIAYRGWKDLATLYVQVNSMLNSFLEFIRSVILLVTLFILANSMNRIVLERMREWGTLRAMGTKKAGHHGRSSFSRAVFRERRAAALGIGLGFAVAGIIDIAGGLPYSSGIQSYSIMVKPGHRLGLAQSRSGDPGGRTRFDPSGNQGPPPDSRGMSQTGIGERT